jgi:hypothetical protein
MTNAFGVVLNSASVRRAAVAEGRFTHHSAGAASGLRPPYERQKSLNRSVASSVYRTVCWMLRWPSHACRARVSERLDAIVVTRKRSVGWTCTIVCYRVRELFAGPSVVGCPPINIIA